MNDSSNGLKLDGAWRRTIMRECDMNKRTKKEKKRLRKNVSSERKGVGAGDKYNNGKTQKCSRTTTGLPLQLPEDQSDAARLRHHLRQTRPTVRRRSLAPTPPPQRMLLQTQPGSGTK